MARDQVPRVLRAGGALEHRLGEVARLGGQARAAARGRGRRAAAWPSAAQHQRGHDRRRATRPPTRPSIDFDGEMWVRNLWRPICAARRGRRRCRSSRRRGRAAGSSRARRRASASGAPAGIGGRRRRHAGGRTRSGRRRAPRRRSRSRPPSPSRGSERGRTRRRPARTTPTATSRSALVRPVGRTAASSTMATASAVPNSGERRVAGRLEQPERPRSPPSAADERRGRARSPGTPRHERDEQDGTRTSAERARVRSIGPAASGRTGACGGRTRGAPRRTRRGRSRARGSSREHELGVGGLPDQEVADPLLAAGPDHEVRVRQAGRVQRVADRPLVDLRRRAMPARGDPPERVHELGPAGVVQGDVELEPGRRRRCASSASLDRAPGLVRQLLEPAEQPDPDALGARARRSRSRIAWPRRSNRPATSSSERAQFSRLNAYRVSIGTPRRTACWRSPRIASTPAAWPSKLGEAARARPAAVAVHDDRDVAGQVLGRQRAAPRRRARRPPARRPSPTGRGRAAGRRSAGPASDRAAPGPLDLQDLLLLDAAERGRRRRCTRSVIFWSCSSCAVGLVGPERRRRAPPS